MLKRPEETKVTSSRKFIIPGLAILVIDISYNIIKTSDFGTLDTMLIFLGISMIMLAAKDKLVNKLAVFGMYFSSIFLLLFLVIYAVPSRLGSNIYDYYGYYATTIPTMFILKSLGMSLTMDSLTSFHAYGIEEIYYRIDLGCFGFYTMILIISTVLAYRITSPNLKNNHSLGKITLILILSSFFSNILRIVILVSVGYYYGLGMMQVFHTFLGWVLFAVIVLPVTYFYLK
jgi:archaeosortase C (PEF-CTERM variant)